MSASAAAIAAPISPRGHHVATRPGSAETRRRARRAIAATAATSDKRRSAALFSFGRFASASARKTTCGAVRISCAALLGAGDEGRAQRAHLAARQSVRRESRSQLEALREIGARQRHEVFHRRVRDQCPTAHQLLHGLGQLADQRQASTHPARALVEPARQLARREPESLVQLAQPPPLLERGVALAAAQHPHEHQRLELREPPHHRLHRVAVQPPEGAHPLVAVDEHERTRLAAHHDDGHLLPTLRQRRDQRPLASRVPAPQRRVAQVELVQLDVHRPTPCHSPPLVLSAHRGSRRDSSIESRTWIPLWSCAWRRRTWPKTPRKSAPCTPNSSCAMSHGSRSSGGRTRSGSGDRSVAAAARAWIRRAVK